MIPMKKWLALAIPVAVLLLAFTSGLRGGDLKWMAPLSSIEARFASDLPRGTAQETVVDYLEAKRLPIIRRQKIGLAGPDGVVQGSEHICARAASYRFFVVNFDVVLCAAFDDRSRLVQLRVRRSSDSI